MKRRRNLQLITQLSICFLLFISVGSTIEKNKIKVACVGDSITFGAHIENRNKDAYPSVLQQLLGNKYLVANFGVSSSTLIRKGKPTVWDQLPKIKEENPDVVIISLGTNDTCSGNRNCWDYKNEYKSDYCDLIDTLRTMPSNPQILICAPTPMVLETPGLNEARLNDLIIRKQRLKELIGYVKSVAQEKNVNFIDLNTPLKNKPELFRRGDGVHPNEAGYNAIAELIYNALINKNGSIGIRHTAIF